MLLCVVCMLYDTVCILSVYGVQVVRFSVHVVTVQNSRCVLPFTSCTLNLTIGALHFESMYTVF